MAFCIDFGPDGDTCRNKACFVANGFSQFFGKNFYGTYSPTTEMSTIRILMSLVISNDYKL